MEDSDIIKLFIERSEKAILKTSEKYGAYLLKVCMNILNRKEDAEECTNDTYLIAWKQIPPNIPQKFLPYLGKIAKNIALNRYDYLKADKRNNNLEDLLSELEECIEDSSKTENILWKKSYLKVLVIT